MENIQSIRSLQTGLPPQHVPFADNVEYLEAKRVELTLLLECASLRRAIELAENPRSGFFAENHDNLPIDKAENPPQDRETLDMKKALEETVRQYEAVRFENEQRLTLPRSEHFPFEDMVRKCDLGRFEQDVIWLLFFKAVSSDFRQKYEDTDLNMDRQETNQEIFVGNLLQILCPGSLREQLQARRYFSVDAPLLRHHLVKFGRNVETCATILGVELELPQRVINWISEDNNTYAVDSPFHVECPETSLSLVVLPQEHIERILALIESYDAYLEKRAELHLDEAISYGRAIVILEYGPPGTGKTLLARALSNHTGRSLVSFKQRRDHTDMFGRRGFAEDIPELFREAQLRKGIVFIDECEQFCLKDSEELRYLLIELERTDAIVIMATNRPEELAPSLDRRFTLKMPFEIPDAAQRRRIWEVHIPKGVPLAEDVDLEHLACSYPFAGGYIKNAVLAAINLALSRSAGRDYLVRQKDLEEAAKLQERHVGGACLYRDIISPKIKLNDALISEKERETVRRLFRMARNYRKVMREWSWGDRIVSHPARGIKALFHGISLEMGLQAVEGMTGELGVSMNRVLLHRIIEEDDVSRESKIAELFSALSGTGQLLVLVDDRGFLRQLEDRDDGVMRELFEQLAGYDGVGVVVSPAERIRLPDWADIFHEKVFFERPTQELRVKCWKKVLNGSIPLSDDLDVEKLARQYDLSLEEIQAAVHRACLLMAAENPGGMLNAQTLEEAIRLVREKFKAQECLFG